MEREGLIAPDLTPEEREVLTAGITEWGGPARCTDQLAAAMDFGSVDELGQKSARLVQALRASAPRPARPA